MVENRLKLAAGLFLGIISLVIPVLGIAADLPNSGVVVKVIDGDTVELEGHVTVRYFGIDAPEIAHDDTPADCFGNDARDRNTRLVLGKKVRLQYEDKGDKVDHHGRVLAYVFLEDGTLVNELLVREGYAFLLQDSRGFSRSQHFLKAQQDAIKNRRGMWGACKYDKEAYYVGNQRSFVFHRPGCSFGKQMSPSNQVRFNSREEAFMEGYHPCRRCKP
ncbi:MAG: thermonuclease family protein [Thermodesulforhabdaceae bacterium]